MSWEDEQERLTREARLFHSSPEFVVAELKKLSEQARAQPFGLRNEKLEPTLLERNDRLINLGLAQCGTHIEVFKALYKHGLANSDGLDDEVYRRGLRIACLSNHTIAAQHFTHNFPSDLIGADETTRILTHDDDDEITALMGNPTVADNLLEALFKGTHLFAELPDERWYYLLSLASRNERLNTEEESDYGPDLGYLGIHDALFQLLHVAPVNPVSIRVLYNVFDRLDFQHVNNPDRIDDVLARWSQLNDRDSDGVPFEGYFTSLPLKDEFRCLVAAMYGRGYVNKQFVIHGTPTARDVAERCAFYGKGDLTIKEMKAGYERDKDAYAFAALLNADIYTRRDRRKLFEEEHLNGSLSPKYLQRLQQVRKRRPYVEGPSEHLEEEANKDTVGAELQSVKAISATIEKRLGELATQLRKFELAVIWGGIALAFVLWLLLKR